ncbi:hypothetical protein RFI_21391 [Reticulomyxa filosa]|uniref:Uncharacterized protein n=1 Tax=Reticulomyxa filosa TaxID=46433 RepID=X6MSA7_RETFI|nr:hypothetical protein RFI_21391 [Reticulomyxa filosa]|eukprot:ETO15970.1 hypothetical protein RFI_21391 [Reticulomyxa filosa]
MKELVTKKPKRRASQKEWKGLLPLRHAAKAKEVSNKQSVAFKIHNGPSNDLSVITRTFGESFDIKIYVKNTLSSIDPTESSDILEDLRDRRNETAKDLSRKVGNNYVQFIDMSRNVINIENQMEEISIMLKNFQNSMKDLKETRFGLLIQAHKSHSHGKKDKGNDNDKDSDDDDDDHHNSNNNNNEANEKYEKSKRLLLAHGKNDPATTTTTMTTRHDNNDSSSGSSSGSSSNSSSSRDVVVRRRRDAITARAQGEDGAQLATDPNMARADIAIHL